MCLSSETRAWGVINCGEGGRLSGAVILQMIPASNVEAGNGSMKRHTYTAPARLGHILLERNAWVGGAVGGLPTVCKGSFIKKGSISFGDCGGFVSRLSNGPFHSFRASLSSRWCQEHL